MRLLYFFFALILTFSVDYAFGQAPVIAYSPNTYTLNVGTAVSGITPNGTGGAVPLTVYATVTTLVPTSGALNNPRGITTDGAGTLYETDYSGNAIYKISSAGVTTLIAGSSAGTAGEVDNATGTTARFTNPFGIVYDGAGSLYVTDYGGNKIRKVSTTSPYAVTTIAGTGTASETDNLIGTSATFKNPAGIDYDGSGNLYVADFGGNKIRKISTALLRPVTTIAGSGTASEVDNTTGTLATFNAPSGLVYTSTFLYISDVTGNKIRKVSLSGLNPVTTLAGSGTAGSVDGTGTAARFSAPYGLTQDVAGNLIVGDGSGQIIRQVTLAGVVTTIAGSGTQVETDGVGTSAGFYNPYAVCADTQGNLFIGDNNGTSSTVRKMLLTGYEISPQLPTGLSFNSTSGQITGTPSVPSIATVYTVTAHNTSGAGSTTLTITTVLNLPNISYSPTSNSYPVGTAISTWMPTNSGGPVGSVAYNTGTTITGGTLNGPSDMAIDASGNIYVTNFGNNSISKYNSSGVYVSTFGTGITMNAPEAIAFDNAGNAYVLNTSAGALYKYNAAGVYQSTTVTGFSHPLGLYIDNSDNIYITDYNSGTGGSPAVKKYSTAGALLLTLPTTNLSKPDGVTVDGSGNIYVLNRGTTTTNGNITKYTSAGVFIATIATGFNSPLAMTNDGAGDLYVCDSNNGVVDVYDPNGILLGTSTGLSNPGGIVVDASGNLFVDDYSNNKLYEYVNAGGYFISPTLPAGLSFSSSTGAITGTPTAYSPATTYTVTASNLAGSGTTTITISCYNTYIWIGNTSSNWNTPSNWSSGVVPTSIDQANISVANPYTVTPVVSANTSVGSIKIGTATGTAPSISVSSGSTLTVNGDITYQSDAQSYRNLTASLTGSGAIVAQNLNIIANTTNAGHPYTEAMSSSITNLTLSGGVNLTSTKVSSDTYNATFSVTGGTTTVAGDLKTTNTAGATSTISVANGTLKLADPTPLSALSSLGTNTVTFNGTSAVVEYNGTVAQTIYTDASITGLSTGVSYTSLTLSGSGIKTALSGNLNISGNYTNSLTNNATNYADLSSPTVTFNGTTQSLAGGAGTGTKFTNVTFSGAGTKTMASGTFAVASTGVLTMSGSSASTVLATGGLLTLNSDISGTATVAAINGPSITGNVTAQRFVTGGSTFNAGRYVYRNYRLMSSPVNEGADGSGNYPYSLNYVAASTIVTGSTSSYGTTAGNPSLYLYNEQYTPSNATFTSGNFIGVTNIANTLATGKITTTDASNTLAKIYVGAGFMMYFRGDKVTNITGSPSKTSYPYVAPESVTFATTGPLNQGTYSVISWTGFSGLLFTTSNYPANAASQGYNLVGNPYPSTIDWSLFSNVTANAATAPIYGANVNPTVYILNPTTSNYDTYTSTTGVATGSGSRYIPSGQGFFVRANNHGASLTFRETAKATQQVTGSNLLLGTPVTQTAYNSLIRLKLSADSINYSDMVVGFNSTSPLIYNSQEDAVFLPGSGAPESLAALSSDNVKTSVKWLPLPKGNNQQIVKLNVGARATGTFTLTKTDLKQVPAIYDIWLMDTYKKDSLDIKHNDNYVFNLDLTDTNSYGANRFYLVIRQNPQLGLRLLDFAAAKATDGVKVNWKTENEENYTNFTLQRSTDNGTTFEVLEGLSSTAAGTYGYLDAKPVAGVNMYRLKLEDLNGTVSYSNIIPIEYSKNASNIGINYVNIYPNPAKSILNLNIVPKPNLTSGLSGSTGTGGVSTNPTQSNSTTYDIRIVGINGQILKSVTTTQLSWQTDVSAFTAGSYIIQVVDKNNKSEVGKGTFIKL